jgi:hypothetical protein
MDGIDTTTGHGVDTWKKVSSLGNEKQAAATNLQDFGDSPNSQPFGPEGDAAIASRLLSSRDTETSAPTVTPVSGAEPRQILESGIRQAFFGSTDNVDDEAWNSVYTRLPTMTLRESRWVWQRIANVVAADCFGGDGNVDIERFGVWMELLEDVKNFEAKPFCLIPHVELMRSQMYKVCEYLVLTDCAKDLLNAANSIPIGPHGQSMLALMSEGMPIPLNPPAVILASLFTPLRQSSLPACAIYSLINAEIRNHLERLIKMYIQMLICDQFVFPSGYIVSLQPIVDGFITVDLKNGRGGRDRVFEDIRSGNPDKIDQRIIRWQQEGIEYDELADEAEKYKLKLAVHNMNDLLFVHFFQVSGFGNRKIDNIEYGTTLIYAGCKALDNVYSLAIPVGSLNFPNRILKLKEYAKVQRQLEHSYMRVVMASSSDELIDAHAENIDIDALLALDPNNMENGKAYIIGDRNWIGRDVSQDIPRLAVRKTGDTPTYEFGTLRGSTFEKENISWFRVYGTKIEKFDSQDFFDPFRRLLSRFIF